MFYYYDDEKNGIGRYFYFLLLTSGIVVFADEHKDAEWKQKNASSISPFFVGVTKLNSSLTISSGFANCMITVYPKDKNSLDYVKSTASLVNDSGDKVKTWSDVKSEQSISGYFLFEKSYSLKTKGKYKLVFTVDCYKNGSVIDKISGETGYKSY